MIEPMTLVCSAQGWTRVGTLLPSLGQRGKQAPAGESPKQEASAADASSLRSSFTRQAVGAASLTLNPRRWLISQSSHHSNATILPVGSSRSALAWLLLLQQLLFGRVNLCAEGIGAGTGGPEHECLAICRISFEDQTQHDAPREAPRSEASDHSLQLPKRPSTPGMPGTPTGQPAIRPQYTSSSKPMSPSDPPSVTILSDTTGSSPAASRVHFRCAAAH